MQQSLQTPRDIVWSAKHMSDCSYAQSKLHFKMRLCLRHIKYGERYSSDFFYIHGRIRSSILDLC